MKKILVIQTAFIGDVVLATALLEKLHQYHPTAQIDILVRAGNETLFNQHPYINKVLVWNKKQHKYIHLLQLLTAIRQHQYDAVINVQRYAATGLLTAFSGATIRIGFHNNPLKRFFTNIIQHQQQGLHETERNQQLIAAFTDAHAAKPKLYPAADDDKTIERWSAKRPYVCMAPTSVWFTKQYPEHKWIELIQSLPSQFTIYLLGAPSDKAVCERIAQTASKDKRVEVLAGKLSFLQSAALMRGAAMNYVNDSAPMHFASAVDAPVTAIYCSTIPAFGYGPLSSKSYIVESPVPLSCRPCGVHGHQNCPQQHYNCANQITVQQLLQSLDAAEV